MSDNEELFVIVFTPPLLTMLGLAEKAKGTPLSEAEVLATRDNAVGITMAASRAAAMAAQRGFNDIDPQNAWTEWQNHRATRQGNEH